jgi:hypothetical protein
MDARRAWVRADRVRFAAGGLGVALVLAFAQIASMAACNKANTVDASTDVLGIGQQCAGPNDKACGVNAVCVLGYCRSGCTTDAECSRGALCLGDRVPFGCSLPSDLACSSSQPCANGLVCGLDGKCRMPCTASADCARNEHECIAGTCVSKGELDVMQTWFSCKTGDKRCTGAKIESCNVSAPGFAATTACKDPTPVCVDGTFVCGVQATPGCCSATQPCSATDSYGPRCVNGACQRALTAADVVTPTAGGKAIPMCWTSAECNAGETCAGSHSSTCPPTPNLTPWPGVCITDTCKQGCSQCLSCTNGAQRDACLTDPNCLACLGETGTDKSDACLSSAAVSLAEKICGVPGCSCEGACTVPVSRDASTVGFAGCQEKDLEPNGLDFTSLGCGGGTSGSLCVPQSATIQGTLRGSKDVDRIEPDEFFLKDCTTYDLSLTTTKPMQTCLTFRWFCMPGSDFTVSCDANGVATDKGCCLAPGATTMRARLSAAPTGGSLVPRVTMSGLAAGESCVDYSVVITSSQ